jgi:hypothetical protein
MFLDYLFLPIILFIGVITSYQDFQSGKIKNKWILFGLVCGMGIWISLLVWSQIVPFVSHYFATPMGFILPSYILKVLINSLISLLVGYLLWYFDLWAAGDAKLFFVFSLLLPLKYYFRSAMPYFPSVVLLINVFAFALSFLVLKSLYIIIKKFIKAPVQIRGGEGIFSRGKTYIKANYKTLVKATLIFFSVLFIFQIIRSHVRSSMGPNIGDPEKWIFLLIFIFLSKVSKYVRLLFKKTWLLVSINLILFFYLVFAGFLSSEENLSSFAQMIKRSFIFGLIFGVLYPLLAYAGKQEEETHVPFALWIFAGAVITVILQGSVYSFFSNPQNFFGS